jgi:hypothetical protein
MFYKAINCRFVTQMSIAILCSVLLISCDSESSSNTTESLSNTNNASSSNTNDASSSDTTDGTVNQVICDNSSEVIIDGRRVCPDE